MSQSPEMSITEPAVLGVSVLGREIATVVLDAHGDAVASNFVELDEDSPDAVLAALVELVDSAPFAIEHIVTTCARADVHTYLDAVLRGPDGPAWATTLTFVSLPAAMAQMARRETDGTVGVVAVDRSGAVVRGASIAVVDASNGVAIEAAQVGAADAIPLTEPSGVAAVSRHVDALAAGSGVARFLCVGSGAQLPGMLGALESGTGRAVSAVPAPAFALAGSATAIVLSDTGVIATGSGGAPIPLPVTADAAPTTVLGGHGLRWWAIGGALGVAALACLTVLVALFTGNDSTSPVAVTSTTTVTSGAATATVTRSGVPVTETVVDEQTVTRTETPRTVTRTATPPTVTQTDTATVSAPAATVTERETVSQTVTVTVTESATP